MAFATRLAVKEPESAVSVTVTVDPPATVPELDSEVPVPCVNTHEEFAGSVKVAVGLLPVPPDRDRVNVDAPEALPVSTVAVVGFAVIPEIAYGETTVTA